MQSSFVKVQTSKTTGIRASDMKGIEDNSEIVFLISEQKHMLRPPPTPTPLIRIVLMRRFSWCVTKYVFMEKYGSLSLNYPCYPLLSGALYLQYWNMK